MSLKVPDEGLKQVLAAIFGSGLGSLTMKLYQNNYAPAAGDAASNYTEATFSGYSSQAVGTWGTPLYDSTNHRWQMTAPDLSFNGSGGGTTNTIYGYFIVDGSGKVIAAEKTFSSGQSMGAGGSNITITPTYTSRSEF